MDQETNRRQCPSGAMQAGQIDAMNDGAGSDLTKTPHASPWMVEPGVWTSRMLDALNKGVKGGVWFSLMDKVFAPKTLRLAFEKVRANDGACGVDNISVAKFAKRLDENIERLTQKLRSGDYRPKPVRRVWIDKPGSPEKRPLGIPAVCDRVVQAAVLMVIEPIFEKQFGKHSYGFRPQRGCKDALRRVDELIKQGHCHVVDADLKAYFDTICHERLMGRIKERIADGKLLGLIELFLKQPIMDNGHLMHPQTGTPQGAVISPLLSNIFLNSLDHEMAGLGFEMVRYADDFVILCKDEASANEALETVRRWVQENALTLHPEKTCVVNLEIPGEGFDFLGYHFRKNHRWASDKSMKRIRKKIHDKTKRTNGTSMGCIIENVNETLRGWFEYFKHSHKTTFRMTDQYTRNRLRAICLRRETGRSQIPKGDHLQRWSIQYFHTLGLFSTQQAHSELVQSARR